MLYKVSRPFFFWFTYIINGNHKTKRRLRLQTTLCQVLGKLRCSCLRSSEASILQFLFCNRYTTFPMEATLPIGLPDAICAARGARLYLHQQLSTRCVTLFPIVFDIGRWQILCYCSICAVYSPKRSPKLD